MGRLAHNVLPLLGMLALGCPTGPVAPLAAPDSPPDSARSTSGAAHTRTGRDQPADRPTGWAALDAGAEAEVRAFADDYAGYLARAKTPRAAVRELLALYTASGAAGISLADDARAAAGGRYHIQSPNRDAAAFIRVGRQPLERGARIIIVSVDAPHIALEQRPIYDQAGLALFDTALYGDPDLPSWLSRPLALHLYMARPGAADGDLELVIGERPDDPVLIIPDLLPHLSRRVQREHIVDHPERMDAVAARSRQALISLLASHGIDERALAQAEAVLVPAGGPVFIGVDRALISGHGHSHRALAYAAVRALADQADTPERSSMVVVVRSPRTESGSSSALGFAQIAFVRALQALGSPDTDMDVLDTRRAYARSSAWVSGRAGGELHEGLVLAPLADDATPGATRRVVDELERAGAAYQLSPRGGWGPARGLAALDLDVVEVSLPVQGRGTPAELLSTLDLHQAYKAARAWLAGS